MTRLGPGRCQECFALCHWWRFSPKGRSSYVLAGVMDKGCVLSLGVNVANVSEVSPHGSAEIEPRSLSFTLLPPALRGRRVSTLLLIHLTHCSHSLTPLYRTSQLEQVIIPPDSSFTCLCSSPWRPHPLPLVYKTLEVFETVS